MKILVCIKQVPDMESKFTIDDNGKWFNTADLAWRMNEYDEYGVEQAVQIKEQIKDADVTVLSIGSAQVKETIKKALAMGCDRGVHVEDDTVFDKEPYQIAGVISDFAKDQNFDLILTGMQSQDRGSAQVGILIGEKLDIPSISTIVDFKYHDGEAAVSRELEGGIRANMTVRPPAVFTCQLGLNTPRYPTLPNIMKAKKKEMKTLPVADLLHVDSRLSTKKMFLPEKNKGGVVLEGDAQDVADKLIAILKEKSTVLA